MAHYPGTVLLPEALQQELHGTSSERFEECLYAAVKAVMLPHRGEDNGAPFESACWCVENQQDQLDEALEAEADERFGTATNLVQKFTREVGSLPALGGLHASEEESRESWAKYLRWVGLWTAFTRPKRQWLEEQLRGRKPVPVRNCTLCHGSGMETTNFHSGRWDGFAIGGRYEGAWTALNQKPLGSPELTSLVHKAEQILGPGNLTSGSHLRFTFQRVPALAGTAVVGPDGWLEQTPGLWGKAQLSPAMEGLSWYAEDEFWPKTLVEQVASRLKGDELCIRLDCHI